MVTMETLFVAHLVLLIVVCFFWFFVIFQDDIWDSTKIQQTVSSPRAEEFAALTQRIELLYREALLDFFCDDAGKNFPYGGENEDLAMSIMNFSLIIHSAKIMCVQDVLILQTFSTRDAHIFKVLINKSGPWQNSVEWQKIQVEHALLLRDIELFLNKYN